MSKGEQLAKELLFTPDYNLSNFEKDWEWEVKFSDLARAFDMAIAAEQEECAKIALAIDSGRGNEKEIAKAIRSRQY